MYFSNFQAYQKNESIKNGQDLASLRPFLSISKTDKLIKLIKILLNTHTYIHAFMHEPSMKTQKLSIVSILLENYPRKILKFLINNLVIATANTRNLWPNWLLK